MLKDDAASIGEAAFSRRTPAGQREYDAVVTVWEVASGNGVRRFSDAALVRSIALSPDSRLLATGSEESHDQAVGCGLRQQAAHVVEPF